ncbi:MAG: hypothetical protein M3O46_21075 [Myxococcota bacterium]|nr:hypothetical protein [Myxococcota bacterium]
MDIEFRHNVVRTALLCSAAAFAVTSSASAQSPSPEDISSARILGTEGVRLAESGDCASAIPKLEASEKLYHAPTTLERLGECQINLGRLVAGTEALNRVLRETLPRGAPPPFVAAQQRAAHLLTATQPRIGRLRIHVDGPPLDSVTVTVDGANVPAALFDGERATDPGAHEVRAVAPGYKMAVASIEVAAGTGSSVSLRLDVDPAAQQSATPSTDQPSAAPTSGGGSGASGSTAPLRIPAIIAFGIGGVGIAVGSVVGIMALGTKSALDNACGDKKMCPASSQSDIDALSTRATISNVGFGVGIVGVAVGTALLLTSRGDEARPASPPTAHRVRISPWLRIGTAGVGGSFE